MRILWCILKPECGRKKLWQHLLGATEKSHEKTQSRLLAFWLGMKQKNILLNLNAC
jgi:hypothetical protein